MNAFLVNDIVFSCIFDDDVLALGVLVGVCRAFYAALETEWRNALPLLRFLRGLAWYRNDKNNATYQLREGYPTFRKYFPSTEEVFIHRVLAMYHEFLLAKPSRFASINSLMSYETQPISRINFSAPRQYFKTTVLVTCAVLLFTSVPNVRIKIFTVGRRAAKKFVNRISDELMELRPPLAAVMKSNANMMLSYQKNEHDERTLIARGFNPIRYRMDISESDVFFVDNIEFMHDYMEKLNSYNSSTILSTSTSAPDFSITTHNRQNIIA